jgi:hypothetical protein
VSVVRVRDQLFVIWLLTFGFSDITNKTNQTNTTNQLIVVSILNFDILPSASNLQPQTSFPFATAALNNVRSREPGQQASEMVASIGTSLLQQISLMNNAVLEKIGRTLALFC